MIVSITITSNREAIIGDALRSVVGWVDKILLVDLGITDSTLEVAWGIAGEKLSVVHDSPERSCADWRNTGLDEAERLGGKHAVMLDTDMRYLLAAGMDIRRAILESQHDTLVVMESSGREQKELIFRLPASRYVGRAHEYYQAQGPLGLVQGLRFSELAKSPGQLAERYRHDLLELLHQVQEDPSTARWWLFLGQAYEGLRQWNEALAAFSKCVNLVGPPEERAWACFRAAICWVELGSREAALLTCAQGMSLCSTIAELPWFSGVQCLAMGRLSDAVAWSWMASSLGYGSFSASRRFGFRCPQGLFEGPWLVLESAYRLLGDEISRRYADDKIKEKRDFRQAWQRGEA